MFLTPRQHLFSCCNIQGLREVMRYGYLEAEARSKRKARAKSRANSKDNGRTRSKRKLLSSEEDTAGEETPGESNVLEEDSEGTRNARRMSSSSSSSTSSSHSEDGSPLDQVAQCFYFAVEDSTSMLTNMAPAGATGFKPPLPPLDELSTSSSALPQGTFAAAPSSSTTGRRTAASSLPPSSHLDAAAVRALNPANTAGSTSDTKEAARARLNQVRFDLKR